MKVTSELVELSNNEAADHMEKLSFLESSKETVMFTQKLIPIVRDVRSKKLYSAALTSRQSSIQMGEEGITALQTWVIKKYFRVQHGYNEFATSKSNINGIESFWAYARTRISKFKGQ